MRLPRVTVPLAASAVLLGACASGPQATPQFDSSASPAAQAKHFIEARNKKGNNGVAKVGLTTCQVAFATHQSGSSQTSGHIFDNRDSTVEAKISQHYYLKGISDAELQNIATRMCEKGERNLRQAGFEVIPFSQFSQSAQYKELYASGKPSPYKTKIKKTEYTVVTPPGYAVTDEDTTNRAAGGLGGLANAFKQAGGANAASKEATLGFQSGFAPVRLMYTVDLASITENTKGFMGMNKTAMVEGKVNLQVGGQLMLVPLDGMGKRSPRGKTRFFIANSMPTYTSKQPLVTDEVFYVSVEDATTTGDKVADGFSTVMGYASALMGGTGTSSDTSRYNVNVKPQAFADLAVKHADNFTAMAASSAK